MEREANMKLYYLKKICYLIFNDYRIPVIQETLNCKIMGEHGYYFP